MVTYIVRRLVLTLIVLIIVSFLSFSLMHVMPGDPAATMLGLGATQDEINALRKELWLDRPFFVQYGHWVYNLMQGDLGISIMYRDPINELLATRLPITLYISTLALVLSTLIGILAGIICAVRRGGFIDQSISLLANLGIAIPVFWLGILGIYFFGYKLGWLPMQGWVSPLDDFILSFKSVIMPVFLLAVPGIAVMARQTRSSMLEVIRQDYIRTAFSKGLRERVVVIRHALRNALIPVITLLGLQVRVLIGGSVLIETIFNIPGMGRLLVTGAFNKDFLVMQAGVLLMGGIVCLTNLLVDVSYGWLDPRIRYE
ncbi:MAG TPA: ABC transporter permease [Dehalococcoidales bacterium]|nr:ABC transporter permease [Dehalococcoidales bacterium]